MTALVIAMPGNEGLTKALADLISGEVGILESHRFPDGETYLRLPEIVKDRSVALVCSLANPDPKFLGLFFAARAARELGARQIGLVAPYLCYMRQDNRFKPGEAVTSCSFASLVSGAFDWLVTVDPHLHRIKALSDIYTIPAQALHAGPLLGGWIKQHVAHPYLIGPDAESLQWVAEVARISGAPYCVLHKERLGDRDVRIAPGALKPLGSATPVLIDDVISSGRTMQEAIRIASAFSTRRPLVAAIHGIFAEKADEKLERDGARLVTTNTIPHASNQIDVAPLLAPSISELMNH
jgi:ribose-phosphate pyrophosphokinase